MSRRIDQPVASVKLTNVATVRLNISGKRFEVACYKNKVLDYRAGLETDLSEVLQTDQIFRNVSKGEFANTSELQSAFPNLTQEEIAVQILKQGKSLQVSEAERNQLYENSLTQIATWIASNCLHPGTGKPYTASQIKQALTTTSSTTANNSKNASSGNSKKKPSKKSNASSSSSTSNLIFTVQPHKPMKQQYLQALKCLQQQMPIQRAAMELQWQYQNQQEEEIVAALNALGISATTAAKQDDNNNMKIRTFTIDPATYRPLQQSAHDIPNSHLEIVRQQVFEPLPQQQQQQQQQQPALLEDNDTMKKEETDNPKSAPSESSSSSSSDEDLAAITMTRKNQRKAKKKQQKKAQRRLVQQEESSSSSESEANDATVPKPTRPTNTSTSIPTDASPPSSSKNDDATTTSAPAPKFQCNTCVGSAFDTQASYRAHFKSDWHRFNQKLKLKKATPVSWQEFQQCDAESFFTESYE